MADFTDLHLEFNTNSQASPTWTPVTGAGKTTRFLDRSDAGLAVASADWPRMTRPNSVGGVDYIYAYTADAVGLGVLGSGGDPTSWDNAKYNQARWKWDNTGTFASTPVFTAYVSSAHAAISRGTGGLINGHTTDTGSPARSYLKGNAWGRVTSAGAPAAAPGADSGIANGISGSVSPSAGANWLAAYQSLQGDNDYITAPFTPAATTADSWPIMVRLHTGPNMNSGDHTPVFTFKYTFA